MKPILWSSGGGVQSTAIAALICKGELPVPDLSVIADTGREFSPVWKYLDSVVIPALAEVGCTLHRAPHSLATVDLWSGKAGNTLLIPAYTNSKGRLGKLPKYCSSEWKVRVVQRFARQHGITDADQWIGYTIDEIERMRVYHNNERWQHVYPLIDLRMSRSDCLTVIQSMGWPPPFRSRCYMCPFQSDDEWQEIKETPEDFSQAVDLEKSARLKDPNVYLHSSLEPLDQVDFTKQLDLYAGIKPCNAGGCFT